MQNEEKKEEIEITPEMARAGAEVIGTGDLTFITADQLARLVYQAMEAVRRKCAASS